MKFEYKGYHAKIEYSHDDDVFFGTIQGIMDLVTFEGQSVQELHTAFEEAIDDYLALCEEIGKTPETEYKGSFNVRISPDLHRKIAVQAAKKGVSLNQFVESAIQSYASEKDAKFQQATLENYYFTFEYDQETPLKQNIKWPMVYKDKHSIYFPIDRGGILKQ